EDRDGAEERQADEQVEEVPPLGRARGAFGRGLGAGDQRLHAERDEPRDDREPDAQLGGGALRGVVLALFLGPEGAPRRGAHRRDGGREERGPVAEDRRQDAHSSPFLSAPRPPLGAEGSTLRGMRSLWISSPGISPVGMSGRTMPGALGSGGLAPGGS